MSIRYVSLFSGIEAASVAWSGLGWEPVAFSEIEPFPCAVLDQRFPDVPNLGDITKVDWSTYAGEVDVVVGGSPCQSFSIAGKREGLAGESGLMFEYIRAVRELMPKYFVWENVPGALSSEGGAAFGQLLSEMDDIGYGLAWRVLDAQFFGVAQRRRRVFLVGCLGDAERAAEILFERDSMRWDYPSSRDKRQELAGAIRPGAGYDSVPVAFKYSAGAKAQTMPTYDGGTTPTLTADWHSPAVAYAIAGNIIDRKPENGGHHLVIENDGACYSLTTADRHAVAYAMRMRAGKPGGGKGPLVQTDVSGTLATGNDQTIFQPVCMASSAANAEHMENCSPTLCARQYKDPPIVVYLDDKTPMVLYDGVCWTVRRLMPIECERLQGFPDGWTDITYRGKPAADGPRYKAIGNSMAVPVMRWIGERINTVDKRED